MCLFVKVKRFSLKIGVLWQVLHIVLSPTYLSVQIFTKYTRYYRELTETVFYVLIFYILTSFHFMSVLLNAALCSVFFYGHSSDSDLSGQLYNGGKRSSENG